MDDQSGRSAAYVTIDFFERRQPIMQEWAYLLTETMGPVIAGAPRPKGDPSPKIESKDEPATGTAPNIAAVPSADQQAGTPRSRTTTTTAGRTTKRRHPAQALAPVNGSSPMSKKQRIRALQKPLPMPSARGEPSQGAKNGRLVRKLCHRQQAAENRPNLCSCAAASPVQPDLCAPVD